MLGEGYTHSYQDLVDSIKGSRHEIILAKSNDSMWRILSTCALTILAGGTTTYEAAYAGLPSINTLETNQHLFLIQELVDKGICLCAGTTFSESLNHLNSLILQLSQNPNELFAIHQRSKALISGLAAEKIVQEIHSIYQSL
jgi:spore coat polysaccharide biosynthesis predicted glycosyltransferase SpsG